MPRSANTHVLFNSYWKLHDQVFFEQFFVYPNAGDDHEGQPEDVANAATIRDAVDKLCSGVPC